MPSADVLCPSHGQQEVFERLLRDDLLVCPICGDKAKRIYSIESMGQIVEFRAGYDRMVFQNFNTKKERDDFLRKENLTKVG